MVRDQHGKKMSKSAGNTVDPLDWMDRFGTDALRFALARAANPGTDAPIGEDNVAAARNFGTKLWNATRFALANGASRGAPAPGEPTDADAWILGRLRAVREQTDALLEDYQFAKAVEGLYRFTWDEFCDWYVELAKQLPAVRDEADRGRHPGRARARAGRAAAAAAPGDAVPHRGALAGAHRRRVGGDRPVAGRRRAPAPDPAAAARIGAVQKLVTEIRRFRTEQRVPDSRRVAARMVGLDEVGLGGQRASIASLVRLDLAPGVGPIAIDTGAFVPTATLEVALDAGAVLVELDTSGVIDVAAERARLGRDLAAARKELDQADRKLDNPKFIQKAPADVVDGIRARRAAALVEIERIDGRLAALVP